RVSLAASAAPKPGWTESVMVTLPAMRHLVLCGRHRRAHLDPLAGLQLAVTDAADSIPTPQRFNRATDAHDPRTGPARHLLADEVKPLLGRLSVCGRGHGRPPSCSGAPAPAAGQACRAGSPDGPAESACSPAGR